MAASAIDADESSGGSPIETDALVIGAGPVGLFQVFELGLLDIRTHVVDSLPMAGGQCMELYPDKPIYDIPATPVCSGRELVARLLKQIEPFAPGLHLGQQVDSLNQMPDGRFDVTTSAGKRFTAKAVFIAGGVGSFQPRRLKVDGVSHFEGTQLFYSEPDPGSLIGKRVVVIGDSDSALDCAIRLATPASKTAANVTLMHRRDEFKAEASLIAKMRALRAAGELQFIAAQPSGIESNQDRLVALNVARSDGESQALPLDVLIVLTGLSPKLGPIADWGLALERKQLVVDTEKFETSVKGIFAVGDVNTYPGKKKLILCGFHEAALAAFAAAAHVFPDKPIHLEYTTTSPRLHRALGVATTPEQ